MNRSAKMLLIVNVLIWMVLVWRNTDDSPNFPADLNPTPTPGRFYPPPTKHSRCTVIYIDWCNDTLALYVIGVDQVTLYLLTHSNAQKTERAVMATYTRIFYTYTARLWYHSLYNLWWY